MSELLGFLGDTGVDADVDVLDDGGDVAVEDGVDALAAEEAAAAAAEAAMEAAADVADAASEDSSDDESNDDALSDESSDDTSIGASEDVSSDDSDAVSDVDDDAALLNMDLGAMRDEDAADKDDDIPDTYDDDELDTDPNLHDPQDVSSGSMWDMPQDDGEGGLVPDAPPSGGQVISTRSEGVRVQATPATDELAALDDPHVDVDPNEGRVKAKVSDREYAQEGVSVDIYTTAHRATLEADVLDHMPVKEMTVGEEFKAKSNKEQEHLRSLRRTKEDDAAAHDPYSLSAASHGSMSRSRAFMASAQTRPYAEGESVERVNEVADAKLAQHSKHTHDALRLSISPDQAREAIAHGPLFATSGGAMERLTQVDNEAALRMHQQGGSRLFQSAFTSFSPGYTKAAPAPKPVRVQASFMDEASREKARLAGMMHQARSVGRVEVLANTLDYDTHVVELAATYGSTTGLTDDVMAEAIAAAQRNVEHVAVPADELADTVAGPVVDERGDESLGEQLPDDNEADNMVDREATELEQGSTATESEESTDVRAYEREIAKLQHATQQWADEYATLEAAYADVRSEFQSVRAAYEHSEQERQQLVLRVREYEGHYKQLIDERTQLRKDIGLISGALLDAKSRIMELETALSAEIMAEHDTATDDVLVEEASASPRVGDGVPRRGAVYPPNWTE